ncbi:MAG: FecR family protein, partial [Deltaproteobacteria bacterium]|nr:FecR family protein [Deltaproteobacteria bacterium]
MRVGRTEWADYAAGRLGESRCAELDDLAARDRDQAAARDRALRARAAMDEIGDSEAPEVAWDSAFARIHWELSLARRKPEPGRRWPLWAGLGTAMTAAAAGLVWWSIAGDQVRVVQPEPASSDLAEGSAVIAVELSAEPLVGLITLVEGKAVVDGQSISASELDRGITAGTTLSTTDGRIAVQFGPGSAFELGPQSSVRVLSFDRARVVLDSRGSIDVEVSHRSPGQSFAIHTDSSRVEVRGTRFRVEERNGHLAVGCTRGEVAVTVGDVERAAVPAGQRLSSVGPSDATVVAMNQEERQDLDAALDIPMLAAWDQSW